MNHDNTYRLFKIELPSERKEDEYATTGLESFLITRFPKSLWYSEEHNSILLDVPEDVTEFHETVQQLCSLPSGGFSCDLRELGRHELNTAEKEWFDGQVKIRKELLTTILPNFVSELPTPSLYLLSLKSVSKA